MMRNVRQRLATRFAPAALILRGFGGDASGLARRDRFFLLRATLALGFIGGFALSRRLWLSSPRFYPTAPLFDFLPRIPFPFDYVWFAALVVLLSIIIASTIIASTARETRRYVVAFVVLAGLLALWDQSRWQPWFYQYFFMLAACAVYWPKRAEAEARGRETLFQTCRLIVASVYFWSGLQKINFNFLHETLPFLLRPFARFLPESFGALSFYAGASIPLVEVFVGVGLLTKRFRDASVVIALVAHAFILALFVPIGRNTVIWPWNVAMPVLVVLLFWRQRDFSSGNVLVNGRRVFHVVVFVLFAVMPALSFLNLWDSYLSSALYSGNTNLAAIHLDEATTSRLPPKVRGAVERRTDGFSTLSVDRWSYTELNVPAYPEPRIFRDAARLVCAYAENPSAVVLEIRERPRILDGVRRSTSADCDGLRSP